MEYTTTVLRTPGAVITLRRPILTEEERDKQMQRIHDAACRLVLAAEREKASEARGA